MRCDATETAHQSSDEVVIGEITLRSHALFAGSIEQEHSRHPDRFGAVEPYRVLFNVGFYRKEVLADELSSFLIFVRLGIQPSTGSSRRSRAESSKMGRDCSVAAGEGLIDVFAPIDSHDSALYKSDYDHALRSITDTARF